MNVQKKREAPRVFKTLEEARTVLKNEAKEFLKKVDMAQMDALIAQRRREHQPKP